jgi:hypothetical protein
MKTEPIKQPGNYGRRCTSTPHAASMISLLGSGGYSGGVEVTADELAAIQKMYEVPVTDSNRPGEELLRSGEVRHDLRRAQADGLRMVAWIARFVEPGEDPVKALVHLAVQAGWDVSAEDAAWSESEG